MYGQVVIVQLDLTKRRRFSGDQIEQEQVLDIVLRELQYLVISEGQVPWRWLVRSYQAVLVWRLVHPVCKRRRVVEVSKQEVGGRLLTMVSYNRVNSEGHSLVGKVLAISDSVVVSGELYTVHTLHSKLRPCRQSIGTSVPLMDMFPVREVGVGKVIVGFAFLADNIEVKTGKKEVVTEDELVQVMMLPYMVEAVQELETTEDNVLLVKIVYNMTTNTSIKTCEMSPKDVSRFLVQYLTCTRACDFYMKIAGKFNSLVACGDVEINPGPTSG